MSSIQNPLEERSAMRFLTTLSLLLLLLPSASWAKPTKAECKAHATHVKNLAKQLGVTEELTGRALLNTIETWVDGNEAQTVDGVAADIEAALAGIEECDASGLSTPVMSAKALGRKLEMVLPWLESGGSVDPCQELISQAIRKKNGDRDGAIADLAQSVRECREDDWLREAQRNLAELYYLRGDVAKGDEQTRGAMQLSENLTAEDRRTLAAVLARPAIEAGQVLMEEQSYDDARQHWEAYIEIFGTPSFDVLFEVEQLSQGTYGLRDLRDARYQLCLACIEGRDVECVNRIAEEYKDDPQLIREMTARAFEQAGAASSPDDQELYRLAFDLLSAWHSIDADSYQIGSLLEQHFVGRPREERITLLSLTDQCWIPMRVVQALKQEGEEFIEEVQVAAACGGGGAEAQRMLDEVYLQAALDKLSRLTILSAREQRAVFSELERELLPKLSDPEQAEQLKARLVEERNRLRQELARAERQKDENYAGCTELLAIIQWNRAREDPYERELSDFKKGCCGFLMGDPNGWMNWMRSRPEAERLADEEIENKGKLMRRYCAG
jgi:hypothetical protein